MALSAVLALRLAAADVAAAESRPPAVIINSASFAHQARAADLSLSLCGAALLRYKVFIKAYAAALYLSAGCAAGRVMEDVPKRLEIEYFWGIAASDFAASTSAGIAANVDAATLARLESRIARINTLYRDVRPGDRYALTYSPGRGTELALNGAPLGSIPGADFAAAMFAIWLGDRPLDAGLKEQLLARR